MGNRALTRRELEVLAGAARGERAAATAYRLGVSVHTVRAELQTARNRLGARTITEAAVLAARGGLV